MILKIGEKKLGLYRVKLELIPQDYDEYPCIYYGDYQGDKREGEGYWIARNSWQMYCAAGSWVNDMPNGWQQATIMEEGNQATGEGKLRFSESTFGNAVNGLWDGEIVLDNDNSENIHKWETSSDKWVFQVKNGSYTIFGEPELGEYGLQYKVAYLRGREANSSFTVSETSVKGLHGIYGFTEGEAKGIVS